MTDDRSRTFGGSERPTRGLKRTVPRGACGQASDRGAALSLGWNVHGAVLSDFPAVLFNSWEDHR